MARRRGYLRVRAELLQDLVSLAEAELESLLRPLGRLEPEEDRIPGVRFRGASVPDREAAERIAKRIASARRLLLPIECGTESLEEALATRARTIGSPASIRWTGPSPAAGSLGLGRLAEAYRTAGGTLSHRNPSTKLVAYSGRNGVEVAEEIACTSLEEFRARRMPMLPFQRPVSLPPRRARALVNLSRAGPGDRVIDPFLGTGSLLLEAALLGLRVTGVDRSSAMVRGALTNLGHFGQTPESLRVEDGASAADSFSEGTFAALISDPPYGRASGSGNEDPESLTARVLQAWAPKIRAGGRIVVALPGPWNPLPDPWELELAVPERIHRSLTREYRVYRRREA